MIDPKERFCTPAWILDPLREAFGPVMFDPCGDPKSTVDGARTVMLEAHRAEHEAHRRAGRYQPHTDFGDGLTVAWPSNVFVFVNPPYGRTYNATWAAKIGAEGFRSRCLVALVPVPTGSSWFSEYWAARALCFLYGRVRFDGGDGAGRFDSVLCYWGDEPEKFERAVGKLGTLVPGQRRRDNVSYLGVAKVGR